VVLIGHSLGANATIEAADELDRQNIPIALIVTFDPTKSHLVPGNVLRLVNFYQNNGFGRRLSPGPGFHGELTNINLTWGSEPFPHHDRRSASTTWASGAADHGHG
jgi:hypothetical protein